MPPLFIRIVATLLLTLPGILLVSIWALGATNAIPSAISELFRILFSDRWHSSSFLNYWGYYAGHVVVYLIILMLGYILCKLGTAPIRK